MEITKTTGNTVLPFLERLVTPVSSQQSGNETILLEFLSALLALPMSKIRAQTESISW
jgi:hypothetical protein